MRAQARSFEHRIYFDPTAFLIDFIRVRLTTAARCSSAVRPFTGGDIAEKLRIETAR